MATTFMWQIRMKILSTIQYEVTNIYLYWYRRSSSDHSGANFPAITAERTPERVRADKIGKWQPHAAAGQVSKFTLVYTSVYCRYTQVYTAGESTRWNSIHDTTVRSILVLRVLRIATLTMSSSSIKVATAAIQICFNSKSILDIVPRWNWVPTDTGMSV